MRNSWWTNSIVLLLGLTLLVGADTWILLWTFKGVTGQQGAVRRSYVIIDEISVLTTKLRDAEISVRQFLITCEEKPALALRAYSLAEQELTVTAGMLGTDSISLLLIKKFEDLLLSRRDELRFLKPKNPELSSQLIAEGIAHGDEVYFDMTSVLARLKDRQEDLLRDNLAPDSQLVAIFHSVSSSRLC